MDVTVKKGVTVLELFEKFKLREILLEKFWLKFLYRNV